MPIKGRELATFNGLLLQLQRALIELECVQETQRSFVRSNVIAAAKDAIRAAQQLKNETGGK